MSEFFTFADCDVTLPGGTRLMSLGRANEKRDEEIERLRIELAAYKKAKTENDDRFQIERDEARAEVERLRAENEALCKRLALHQTEHEMSGPERECDWCALEREIHRLEKNNARLREALEAIANGSQDVVGQRIARTALTSKEGLERCSGLKKEK